MVEKRFIFVCCGAGKLSSYMAAEGIEKGLKKKGVKDIRIQHGMISDIPRYESQITVLVCSTNYQSQHSFPVFNGLSFVTGDTDGQEKLIDELVSYLNEHNLQE